MSNDNGEIEAFFKHLAEHNSLQPAIDTSFYDGKVQGKNEAKRETAKTMLAKGFDVDTITEITKLTVQEIEKL